MEGVRVSVDFPDNTLGESAPMRATPERQSYLYNLQFSQSFESKINYRRINNDAMRHGAINKARK